MKFGAYVIQYDYVPREEFAQQVAELVRDTILYQSKADEFKVSLVELEDGEVLAD